MKYSLRLLCICLLCCASLATAEEKWQRVEPNAKALHWKYFEVQWERLLSGKYAELEKEAATPTFADAESCGISPENALFAMFGLEDWRKDPEFNQVFKALDGWDATFPKSPYSRLARATTLIDYAWVARGAGVAGTVNKDGWKLFGDRLVESLKKEEEAMKLGGDKHGVYWRNLLFLARGLQAPPAKTKEMVNDALKRFPEYPGIYYAYCIAILPRWGGAEGEWQAWLNAQNKEARWGGKEMDPKLYAQILWQVFTYIRDTDGPFFGDKHLSWEKAKLGLDQLCEKYPKSTHWNTVRACLASVAGDRKSANAAFDSLNGKFDGSVIDPPTFEAFLKWAGRK